MKRKIKPKLYAIIADKVDESCEGASHRIYKYTEKPSRDAIAQVFYDAIMLGLTEVIDFDDEIA